MTPSFQVVRAAFSAAASVVGADLFREDVAGAGERGLGVQNPLLLEGVGGGDEFLGLAGRVGVLVRENPLRERREALFGGEGGARAALRAEGQVKRSSSAVTVSAASTFFFSSGVRCLFSSRLLRMAARRASGFLELLHAVAHGGDHNLVHFAGGLLAVAGDEGHGRALGEEFRDGGDAGDSESGFPGDAQDMAALTSPEAGGGGGRRGDRRRRAGGGKFAHGKFFGKEREPLRAAAGLAKAEMGQPGFPMRAGRTQGR